MRGRLDKKGASVDCQTNAPTGLDICNIWYPFHFVSQSYVERYKHKCIAVSANIGDPISTKKVISNFVICQVHFHHRVLSRPITRIFWLSHRELVCATQSSQLRVLHANDDDEAHELSTSAHHRHHTCRQPGGYSWPESPSQCDLDGTRPRDHRILLEATVSSSSLQYQILFEWRCSENKLRRPSQNNCADMLCQCPAGFTTTRDGHLSSTLASSR